MSLSTGARLGTYEILGPIGAGGMGEVYRAHDTRLKRDVALKILPEAFAGDSGRMARFEREAQVLAALNHPNIAAIYGIEDRAIVMELVEGETLAGPLPIETALDYARQIALALEAAHEKGIIHRDLKPANVKITPAGMVKVLDFGLAKLAEDPAPGNASNSPTLTMSPTRLGMILGTAAYMAPEQARGAIVDKRADIWAFGAVLYEMLAGKPAFAGESTSDILAAVLRADPDWTALPAATPSRIRKLLRRCLERDRKQRLRDIGEARIAIEAPEEEIAVQPTATRRWMLWAAAAGVLAIASAVLATGWWMATRSVLRPSIRLSVDLEGQLAPVLGRSFALSPDGTRLVFASRRPDGHLQLALRLLETQRTVSLVPVAGVIGAFYPFFSPDGHWIAFFDEGKLKKIAAEGGSPITLCEARLGRGGSWGEDGNIVFTASVPGPLFVVPASGGAPHAITELDRVKREVTHRNPQWLPGAQAVLFTASNLMDSYEGASIVVYSFKTGGRKTLVEGGYYGRYVPSGHLAYMHQGTLFAVALDLKRMELTGSPVPILDDVFNNPNNGDAHFDVSSAGELAYLAGPNSALKQSIVWLDASGKTQPLIAGPGGYSQLSASPDGRRLAFAAQDGKSTNVWVYDWEHDRLSRLTSLSRARYPVWAEDSKHLVFCTENADLSGPGIYWMRADGAGEAQRLVEGAGLIVRSFSPDGKRLAYNSGGSIWIVSIDDRDPGHLTAGKPEMFLRDGFDPHFSPDGRWMAYTSSESGLNEVYVRAFPGGASETGGKWAVSRGRFPNWSRNGRELFFLQGGRIMVAAYTAKGDSFVADPAGVWSERLILRPGGSPFPPFALVRDEKRIAVVIDALEAEGQKPGTHIMFLLNFFDELRRRGAV